LPAPAGVPDVQPVLDKTHTEGAADFLQLDEFSFSPLRGLHAVARIAPAQSG
jgi:hypothetical protein